jgi:two-component system NtrC family response regulator
VLLAALARSNNTLAVAARMLGISRPTLYGLMEAHGLDTGIVARSTDPTPSTETTATRG